MRYHSLPLAAAMVAAIRPQRDEGDLEEITITKDGIFANTKAGEPMRPLDHILYPNRHERRKAQALARRERRAIGADW